MRHRLLFFGFMLCGLTSFGQAQRDTMGGLVSYTTSLSVYVKFPTTQSITAGDTLYIVENGAMQPALVVKYISSTSCVGDPIGGRQFEKGTRILAWVEHKKDEVTTDSTHVISQENKPGGEPEAGGAVVATENPQEKGEKPSLKGRISAAAYINFSDYPGADKQRMRYVFSVNARKINNSNFSAEAYMSFRHTIDEWQDVQQDFKRAFKVYSLALEYDLKGTTRFWAGRKINYNISNIGAMDGLQAEHRWKKAFAGAFVGSAPDRSDYSYNPNLSQYGAYGGHIHEGKNGVTQSTLALVEQRNSGMTDRRFAYLQHINSSIRHINIFTSFEFDLYTLENNQPKNTFDITSIYLSVRYRVSDKLSLFGSYDARNNVIYYETYKNLIDQLIDEATRKGFRFSVNYRPMKKITLGANAGYRFQKDNPFPSKNLNTYMTISRVPGLQASATLSATWIQSAFMDGLVYGLRISRDIIRGKLYGELQYRIADYGYRNLEFPIKQSIAGANLSWRITKKLSFACNYEGEIQNHIVTSRIYTNLIQRF